MQPITQTTLAPQPAVVCNTFASCYCHYCSADTCICGRLEKGDAESGRVEAWTGIGQQVYQKNIPELTTCSYDQKNSMFLHPIQTLEMKVHSYDTVASGNNAAYCVLTIDYMSITLAMLCFVFYY